MLLNVEIKNRVARYIPSDETPVCGNSGDQIKFTFDNEWANVENKTARFKWNGRHEDVEFSGDTCDVPVITTTEKFTVGVYAGEVPEAEDILSTTEATIQIRLSVRCGKTSATNNTGANYTNEARGYAAECKKAAEQLEACKGMEKVGTLSVACEIGYDENGMEEMQLGGVAICDGILPLYAADYLNMINVYNRYRNEIKEIFESARIVELTIDTRNGYHEEPVHKEICKGGHLWYGAPKLIGADGGMAVGLGVNNRNEGTHLAYADGNSGGDESKLWGLSLSAGALRCIEYGVTLNFTAYK